MDISCLIPTQGRPEKLVRAVAALAKQSPSRWRHEVLIGVDGPDRGEADAVAAVLATSGVGKVPVRVFVCDRSGPAATRNRLIDHARGSTLLFLNDDVRPAPDLVATHANAQEQLIAADRPAMVLGAAPWVIPPNDTLFDRMVRETSMVFFYDQMVGPRAHNPDHDWGFRHGWTLNLSVPADAVRKVGGFDQNLGAPCYEDLEFAWRLHDSLSMPVLYRPQALVQHDHRYHPKDYLHREQLLGAQAWQLAMASPDCALALFGRDLTDEAELDYCRAFVEHEQRDIARAEERFCQLATISAESITGEHQSALMQMLYQQHITLKRWWWRSGLMAAAEAPVRR
jgi:GT2 family glycosyltransferase